LCQNAFANCQQGNIDACKPTFSQLLSILRGNCPNNRFFAQIPEGSTEYIDGSCPGVGPAIKNNAPD
jgi:hypothetical protein